MHASGNKLDNLCGIAAILRYPIEIDQEMDDYDPIEEEKKREEEANRNQKVVELDMKEILKRNADIDMWLNQQKLDFTNDGFDMYEGDNGEQGFEDDYYGIVDDLD